MLANDAMKRSVCVLGAGAAGLCALRHFTSKPEHFGPIVCFEQTDRIGGLWNYTEATGCDSNGLPIHSAVYRDLSTNAPVQIMQYPDFPVNFAQSYVHHSKVLHYIHDYATHFNLQPYIKLQQQMKLLTRRQSVWKVTVTDLTNSTDTTYSFDIVIFCPGRFFCPYIPEIEAMNAFTGQVMHSRDYRFREPFRGQRVAVIGAGPSGVDICLELSTAADKVIFINRTNTTYEILPGNMKQIKGQVRRFKANSIVIDSGHGELLQFNVESVIFATGFKPSLEHLDQEGCGLKLNADGTVDGIYRHFLNIKNTSMALLSIIEPSISFPLYHQQMLYFIKVLLNEITLPSPVEMHQIVASEIKHRQSIGRKDADRHQFKIDEMREYFIVIQSEAKLPPVRPVVWALLKEMERSRMRDPEGYKQINYKVVADDAFEIV